MRKLVVALVALTAAAALVVMGLPALAAGGPRSFKAHAKTVRAGQHLKVSGKGCGSQATVRFYLNDFEIDTDTADRAGQFVDNVEIPSSTELGKAELKAGCSGYRVGLVTITVLGSRFDVEPRRVEAGELITVSGTLCKASSYVTIKLNGELIGSTRANSRGQFRKQVRVPSDAHGDDNEVSARCYGKFVGAKIIVIIIFYPTPQSLVSADRTAVPAGQTVTLRGSSCPTGNPTASLDGQPLNLNVDRSAGKGFKATATIPASVSPGRHSLWAGCDAGSAGTSQLQVLEGAQPAAAKMEFGSQPPSGLALWFALFSGIAVLIASVAITARRRS
jgi:hypothetical protein